MVSTALLAGFLAGFCLFVIQRSSTLPLIHTAETYEKAGSLESRSDAFASEPLRSISTLLGDVFVAVGFGLIVTGIYTVSGSDGWEFGLLIGLAGFVTFHLAPAVVVPPAVPGMEVASLAIRQTGWLVAVASAMIGITLVFCLSGLARLSGLLFLVLPGVVFRLLVPIPAPGTPLHSLALLNRAFVTRTLGVMLVFWLILGTLSGYLFTRAQRKAALVN
ncbi:MAG: CbtA family protein [Candidatus Binatus sp.]|uniref:CbtA family protein n=1 Tax=Candidatus Binatus sp. TaxID=2811406 RepID=UPI00271DB038|nr:CbtA family protein [Candidatus Binatus sp.]MDO8434009.1 CbtA family protein [Candidatus Binatus sp.]